MIGRLISMCIVLLLIGCSAGRFINIETSEQIVSEPVSEMLLLHVQHLRQTPVNELYNACQEAEGQYQGYALHVIQLVCVYQLLPHDAGDRVSLIKKYNDAVEPFVRLALNGTNSEPYNFILDYVLPTLDGEPIQSIVIAADVIPKDPFMKTHTTSRIGISVVGSRKNNHTPQDKWYPAEGVFRPITVTANVTQSYDTNLLVIQLEFHVMSEPKQINFANTTYPLTYDLATPYLMLTESAEIDDFELTGLFFADGVEDKLGIYAIEALSSQKKPILMIHGLNSSPLIWRRLSWALYSNPEIAERYQIWHAFYPSGPPPFFNAKRLRAQLDELKSEIFPDHAIPPMWLIGHSMGGIISRTFVVDSHDALWNKTFTVPPEQLGIPDRELEQLRAIFYLEAKQHVEGAVFIDTPHKGSQDAEGWIGILTSSFIELPTSMRKLFGSIWQDNRERFLTEDMRPFMTATGPDSVSVLSPKHPLLIELSKLTPVVPAYSVIGNRHPERCSAQSGCMTFTDGVVSYQSAHLPTALDELIVLSRHDSYQSPQAIEFIIQKLRDVVMGPAIPVLDISDAQ